MDRRILEEFSEVKEEIKDLECRIEKAKRELDNLESMIVIDSVTRGKKGKKTLGTVRITGRPTTYITRKQKYLEQSMKRLDLLRLKLLRTQEQAEEYINGIEKSELRMIFRLYFVDDLSYAKVALKMNQAFPKRKIKYTDENVKKRIERFLKKNENVPQCPEKL